MRALGVAVLVAAVASSCGIPQQVFLARPILGTVDDVAARAEFDHDEQANDSDSFLGYELYYKFYDSTLDPAETASQFAADRTAIENAPPGTVISTLEARDYNRVFRDGAGTRPVIEIDAVDKALPFTFSVDFPNSPTPTQGGQVEYTASTTVTSVIYRDQDLLGNPPTTEGFTQSEIEPGSDPDVPPASGNITKLGLVGLAYGVDFATGSFATVYSQATAIDKLLQIYYQ